MGWRWGLGSQNARRCCQNPGSWMSSHCVMTTEDVLPSQRLTAWSSDQDLPPSLGLRIHSLVHRAAETCPGPCFRVHCLVPVLLASPGSNAWSRVCWRRHPSFTESHWCFASDGWRIFLTFFGLCSESTCSDAHRAE